ncbi:hypothetical protein [Bhargavaea ginsengi]|uniref:hypothetical protein n=1 Tax=Bhargavaea ginsengi TaxID=426757 RepID=UPI003C7363BB
MNGTITSYMSTAYTSEGIRHNYRELLSGASKAFLLKAPPTGALSVLLREVAQYYVKRGWDVELFHDPLTPDGLDAVHVVKPGILFVQASHPVALEPVQIGGAHRVVTFYDGYDEDRLKLQNGFIRETAEKAEEALRKTFASLKRAKELHDGWEEANRARMSWELADKLSASLAGSLFGDLSLNKAPSVVNRYIGTLTAEGAQDFFDSVTKGLKRRLLIKAHPGTGKSTMMKKLGKEAEARGLDVIYGWCALDPGSVDLIVLPELSVCVFDATKPHEYGPEREGDEIVDMLGMCRDDETFEKQADEIEAVYREAMLDARAYMNAHVREIHSIRARMDSAINQERWEEKFRTIREQL